MTKPLELEDIQGLLIRGHGELSEASYLMFRIDDANRARAWMKGLLNQITDGVSKPHELRLQIAFTFQGLAALGMEEFVSHGFSVEFSQGMATEYKSRVLGDLEESAPENWKWGGPNNGQVDFVLMVFANTPDALKFATTELENDQSEKGLELVHRLNTNTNQFQKEHFGFKDGMSQPVIVGLSKKVAPENTVLPGEFILGYKNGYDQFPDTPAVPSEKDPDNTLPNSKKYPGLKDFGANGSYMVFRQLSQDVPGFWEAVHSAVKNENPDAGSEECIFLASKMVGRWPNGKPITLSREKESEYSKKKDEDFLYAKEDAKGHGCPFGSHIRRSNPRDAMPDNKPEGSIRIANRHRILRRGRNFGPPLVEDFDPQKLIEVKPDGEERGLQFICFNANIQRQFEFIQHQWNNNTKFAGLYSDPDPILGIKDPRDKSETHDFTIQAEPVRRKIKGLKRHVHVMGGAYFFMPGLKALKFLTEYSPEKDS